MPLHVGDNHEKGGSLTQVRFYDGERTCIGFGIPTSGGQTLPGSEFSSRRCSA